MMHCPLCQNAAHARTSRYLRWDKRHEAMQGVTVIDLTDVTRVDTAGVALLAHLVAVGKKQGASVTLRGASENVVTLAQLYNLPQDVLPR